MGFITESLEDVHEPIAAPEGDYDVRIIKAERKESKKGRDMIALLLKIDGYDAQPFNHFLLSWNSMDDDEDQIRMRKLEIKRFVAAFDLPDDFDAEDCVGQTASVYLTQEVGDDDVVRNRMRLPRIKE